MVSSSQIKAQLARLLEGRIDLDNFEDWFVHNTWNIHHSGSAAAENLTSAIEESLSEFSSRHIDEQDLQRELREILESDTRVVNVLDAAQAVHRFERIMPAASTQLVPLIRV